MRCQLGLVSSKLKDVQKSISFNLKGDFGCSLGLAQESVEDPEEDTSRMSSDASTSAFCPVRVQGP